MSPDAAGPINVTAIASTEQAFAALKDDGSVVAWGDPDEGGDASAVSADLASGVASIYASQAAFVALKDDSSIVVWGSDYEGGIVPQPLEGGVCEIVAYKDGFGARSCLQGPP